MLRALSVRNQASDKCRRKGIAYALFRDALPDALRLFRARKEGKPLEEIPPVEYLFRKGEFRASLRRTANRRCEP